MFDQNGDGLISGEELKLTMRSLGEALTEDEVKKASRRTKSLEKSQGFWIDTVRIGSKFA